MARTDSAPWLRQTLLTLLCAIDEGIHVIDETGVTVYYNAQAAEIEGLDIDSVMGKHILDVYPSLSQENSTLLQVCTTKRPLLNQQQTFSNFKGRRITTINSTLPIIIDNRLVGAVEISKNITTVRELSEKLVDLQAQVFELPENNPPRDKSAARFTFADILGQSSRMVDLKSLAQRSALTDSPILVAGETGVGKELFVQAVHNASKRRNKPFVAQNCAALPETLLESILFGTTRGSFSGAENRPGLFEVAHGGTLFLEEIHAVPVTLQAKLLRVLQDGHVRRVGDSRERPSDVRLITSMTMEPMDAVRRGLLRDDLFYRISVVTIRIPPLRERKEDIVLLSQHFINHYNKAFGRKVIGLSEQAQSIFSTYDWPGNVRELQHALEGVMNVIEGDIITPDLLPPNIREGLMNGELRMGRAIADSMTLQQGQSLHDIMAEVEARLVEQAMHQARGNVTSAAEILRIPRQTLQYKLRSRSLTSNSDV
jgi:arginine utilization regulatory protein